ncbi:MAG: signal recognition particle-docking protein FtsY, partial [Chloroflexi bacterium]|nr:signal recognition particle-docking protein FtsY [Chloroflexota bacterium]
EWEEVEETLIAADVGAERAFRVVVEARRHANRLGPEKAVRAELRALLAERPSAPWQPTAAARPAIILVVGVNGTGKTTTIAKLTARFQREGHTVLLAAADTFRAAAIDQLRAWAGRVGAPVIAHAPGADPSAVVYDALDAALARDVDLLIVDTAERLHTKNNLMDELAKIRRTISKRLPGVEPEVLFVLDATTGQNGLGQAQAFHAATRLTGLVVTKLDSTARGGIVFAIEQALDVPVRFVGVGERVDDLVDFDPEGFVAALFADPR